MIARLPWRSNYSSILVQHAAVIESEQRGRKLSGEWKTSATRELLNSVCRLSSSFTSVLAAQNTRTHSKSLAAVAASQLLKSGGAE
ncbi:hypothetical protein CBOM_06436 [Ceraceosorus bombacis]|uniref:Uncharacterized protein n=1 Tax=Ceraceosorus bombacis TaxID=401625 RepID=A0A0P1BJD3_9BASI|nr:hypothetical protein CBOM_06436 [Ceraceosorus bombacis]